MTLRRDNVLIQTRLAGDAKEQVIMNNNIITGLAVLLEICLASNVLIRILVLRSTHATQILKVSFQHSSNIWTELSTVCNP